MNLAELLTLSAEGHPDHVALRLDDVEVTYRELDDASARVAGLLASKGFSVGDRVGIMLPNVPWFAMCYYGVLRAGGVVVPMNVLLEEARGGVLPERPRGDAAVRLGGVRRGCRGRGQGGRRPMCAHRAG